MSLRLSHLKLLLRVTVSVACILLLIFKLQWHDIFQVFAGAHWGLLVLAWAVSPILILLLAWRLRLLLGGQGISLSYGNVLRLTWAGQFYNSFLPGSTGGDLYKLYEVARLAPSQGITGTAVVVVDRLLAFVALAILAVIGAAIEAKPLMELARSGGIGVSARLLWALAALGAAGITVLVFRRTIAAIGEKPRRWLEAAGRTFHSARQTLKPNRYTLGSLVVALAIHLINFLVIYLLALALRIEITYLQVLSMMPVVMLVIALPITINGHGLRELFMITYFDLMKIHGTGAFANGGQIAVALSLAFVVNDLLTSLPGGLWNMFAPPQAPVPQSAAA